MSDKNMQQDAQNMRRLADELREAAADLDKGARRKEIEANGFTMPSSEILAGFEWKITWPLQGCFGVRGCPISDEAKDWVDQVLTWVYIEADKVQHFNYSTFPLWDELNFTLQNWAKQENPNDQPNFRGPRFDVHGFDSGHLVWSPSDMRVLDAWLRRYPHLKIANLEEVRDGMEQDIEEYQRRIGDRQSALFAVKERLDKAGYAERVALANSSRLPVPYTEVDWEAVAAGQAAEPYLVVIDDAPKEAEWIYAKHAKPYGLNYGYGWDRESVGINYVIGYCQKVGYVAAYGKTRNPGVFELVWPLPADKYARCPEKT